jgi:hypothetical protein
VDGMMGPGVRGHHVAHPPLAQSGLGVVPDDEQTFQGSHPRAYASQDRMHHTTQASVSREERARKVEKRAAMGEDSGKAGLIVCQGSER